MDVKSVRTRVAPSPTGDPHVGTAYVALLNYLFARKAGGAFILRIEDTDRARSTAASESAILESLRWLGLQWDEGPDVGGPHGPYRQSERSAMYQEQAQVLVTQGDAFLCYCTPERLGEMRAEQRRRGLPPAYDGRCQSLSESERKASERTGGSPVIRLRVPSSGTCTVQDLFRGEISIEWATVDMQVLIKSDGLPTYHLANVVDDHFMEISHVLRGEEWLSSAPKHILLYEYFGWQMPQLGHLPLLRNADKSKLSKRKNPTSIQLYRRMGYLPEALLNFLGLLAIATPEGTEVATLAEMVDRFELAHIALGGPVFDVAKLDWLNGRYLRETVDEAAFLERVQAWAVNREYLSAIAPLARARIERLSDLGPLLSFFFAGRLTVSAEQLRDGKLDDLSLRQVLALALSELDALPAWQLAAIEAALRSVAERLGKKFRDVVRPLYVAITGSPTSVPLFNAMELLGRDLCRERLRVALEQLGGVSKAELERWRADHHEEIEV